MTFILNQIFSFVKLLNSDKGTTSIAAGFALGMIMGFSPGLSLQMVFAILILFFFRVQIGAALLAAGLFKLIAYIFDPAFHALGVWMLELDALRPTYETLYAMPVIPWTRFNNTVVMGSGLAAIALAPGMFLLSKKLVDAYRAKVVAKFQSTQAWKAFKASTLYQWYSKYEAIKGE